ncbi:FAD-dependent oxidoreductase [Pseudodesulfovibrio piezophilus]|uniref:FAD-dependent pyridine nucleotide-disulphide oxidoreductase n=1 Tax=Pseudodesulfovibrio piezophilus (strain DSM 21447 / JCM 15486 / C1TLV30) TaxID=1322246 RepID=M1WJW9_PSEP2|nr:FAD-dependent oxidoreductase [Pseudodesulfovibrio piezophilus]CCH48616.1 FAD-dependent pyridine nucleotide-disulphide oxidoreductase [Pseudodesulfovibrio piezophilus C1TLV30]
MSPLFKKDKESDWFLPEDVRKQLSKTFDGLKGKIVLEVFSKTGVNDEFSSYMFKFCDDLARLTNKIKVKRFEIPSERATELGITASPTMCINPDEYHIRFLGAPVGEEGKAFITAIMLVSLNMHGLSEVSMSVLQDLDKERLVQVFVSPTCPYCPGQTMHAIKCAIAKPNLVQAECVEMSENPKLTEQFNIGSVPHTIFNGGVHDSLGLMPEERFTVELVYLKSAENLLEDGDLPGAEDKKAPKHFGTIEPGEVDLVIIGAGPAGLTAGIYAVRAGLKTVVLEKNIVGGQVALTPVVENYPGFTTVPGKQLMDIMGEHAREYVPVHEGEGVETITMPDPKEDMPIQVTTNRGAYSTKAIILTTGAAYRQLGVPGETRFFGRGVNYCASCDGYLYKGKSVAIVGGGNTALTDALHLKNLGVDVTIIHRREEFRAQKPLQDSLEHEKIPVLWNTVVEEIDGDDRRVHTLKLRNTKDETTSELPVDGLFVAIGQEAATDLAKLLGVTLKEDGFVEVDTHMRTNIPRIYAAGDLTGGLQQIVTAIGEGSIAAMSAFEDISHPYWKE